LTCQIYSGTNLASGKYDFQFSLFNAPSGGMQIGWSVGNAGSSNFADRTNSYGKRRRLGEGQIMSYLFARLKSFLWPAKFP